MSKLEYCFECDLPTGNAGAMEDSLMFDGNPYCDDCYAETMISENGRKAAKVVELEQQIKLTRAKADQLCGLLGIMDLPESDDTDVILTYCYNRISEMKSLLRQVNKGLGD